MIRSIITSCERLSHHFNEMRVWLAWQDHVIRRFQIRDSSRASNADTRNRVACRGQHRNHLSLHNGKEVQDSSPIFEAEITARPTGFTLQTATTGIECNKSTKPALETLDRRRLCTEKLGSNVDVQLLLFKLWHMTRVRQGDPSDVWDGVEPRTYRPVKDLAVLSVD